MCVCVCLYIYILNPHETKRLSHQAQASDNNEDGIDDPLGDEDRDMYHHGRRDGDPGQGAKSSIGRQVKTREMVARVLPFLLLHLFLHLLLLCLAYSSFILPIAKEASILHAAESS